MAPAVKGAVMAIDFQLAGLARDLGGGFTVRRFLPSGKDQSVGPLITGLIAQAADDWEVGRFAAVPGETEFIPLPERHFG